ncbi:Zein-binding domain [Macleaya cordata]|uniref:Zein-binding domain n=1 Tax=Macleaya cordata TaxID=56857 RepID=A0A200Q9S4_MACCD|nr:Zein-binding domain [Macleaya cordata]
MTSAIMPLALSNSMECSTCGCTCSLVNSSYAAIWQRTVKRKFEEIEEGRQDGPGVSDYNSVARVEIENECVALREALSSQQESIQELYTELEEERNASASAANEAMSMILRLQREKAEIQMEARQFKRFAEEKMAHDQQEILVLEDMLFKREEIIQSLSCEVQMYKHRMLSFGLTEDEVEGGKGVYGRSQSMVENSEFELPPFDYPPLKCKMNETHGPIDCEDIADIEKYSSGENPIAPFGDTPRSGYSEIPCAAFGETPKNGTKVVLEKAEIGQSPRQPRHARRLSTDSSSSFPGLVKEIGPDYYKKESPRPSSSFKKMAYCSQTEDCSNLRNVDNTSDLRDDMSDRVYTIDSIHHGTHNNNFAGSKTAIGICEDYVTTPRESLNQTDIGDPDIKKLYMRLQLLEADRESMKQAIISMRTEKAQLVLLREIAQQLYKEMTPERRMPVKKTSIIGTFSFVSALKWIVSFVFWRNKAHRSKFSSPGLNTGLKQIRITTNQLTIGSYVSIFMPVEMSYKGTNVKTALKLLHHQGSVQCECAFTSGSSIALCSIVFVYHFLKVEEYFSWV